MKKMIFALVFGVISAFGFVATSAMPVAANSWNKACEQAGSGLQDEAMCNDQTSNEKNISKTVQTILNTVFGIAGLLAVVMIILNGQRFMTSAGDTAKLTKAKAGLTGAVIGLIIVVLAWAVVGFVVGVLVK